jgi:hypothetical protein
VEMRLLPTLVFIAFSLVAMVAIIISAHPF